MEGRKAVRLGERQKEACGLLLAPHAARARRRLAAARLQAQLAAAGGGAVRM